MLRSHAYRARIDVITTNPEVSVCSCASPWSFWDRICRDIRMSASCVICGTGCVSSGGNSGLGICFFVSQRLVEGSGVAPFLIEDPEVEFRWAAVLT